MASVRQEEAMGKRCCGLCGEDILPGQQCIKFYAFRDSANVCAECCRGIASDEDKYNRKEVKTDAPDSQH